MQSRTQTGNAVEELHSQADEEGVRNISLAKLDKIFDLEFYNVWCPAAELTRYMVEDARLSGEHLKCSKPWSEEEYNKEGWEGWATWMHCCRIAYLIEVGWDDPIELLFDHDDWPCVDGNHRLKAAFFRGDPSIKAVCQGMESVCNRFVFNDE